MFTLNVVAKSKVRFGLVKVNTTQIPPPPCIEKSNKIVKHEKALCFSTKKDDIAVVPLLFEASNYSKPNLLSVCSQLLRPLSTPSARALPKK